MKKGTFEGDRKILNLDVGGGDVYIQHIMSLSFIF